MANQGNVTRLGARQAGNGNTHGIVDLPVRPVTVEAGRLVAREALEGLAMLHQKGRLAARRQMDLAFQADEVVFRGGQGAQRQCASAQFLPVPASATSGTESCTAGWPGSEEHTYELQSLMR